MEHDNGEYTLVAVAPVNDTTAGAGAGAGAAEGLWFGKVSVRGQPKPPMPTWKWVFAGVPGNGKHTPSTLLQPKMG